MRNSDDRRGLWIGGSQKFSMHSPGVEVGGGGVDLIGGEADIWGAVEGKILNFDNILPQLSQCLA